MKARIPIPNRMRNALEQETQIIIEREMKKQQNNFTRRLFKLMCCALHNKYGFGKDRCEAVINSMSELLIKSDTDEVFWEHIDRLVIDRFGLPFERDYTDRGKAVTKK